MVLLTLSEGGCIMVSIADVTGILRPWLGAQLLANNPGLQESVKARLGASAADEKALRACAQAIDSLLFYAVRDTTKGQMQVRLDDGSRVRVRVGDFPVIADELMYLMFGSLPRDERGYRLLREYSFHNDSLSALRALYEMYAPCQSPEELAAIRRIIRDCHPAFRWRMCLH
jgi:hypothetical protein